MKKEKGEWKGKQLLDPRPLPSRSFLPAGDFNSVHWLQNLMLGPEHKHVSMKSAAQSEYLEIIMLMIKRCHSTVQCFVVFVHWMFK